LNPATVNLVAVSVVAEPAHNTEGDAVAVAIAGGITVVNVTVAVVVQPKAASTAVTL